MRVRRQGAYALQCLRLLARGTGRACKKVYAKKGQRSMRQRGGRCNLLEGLCITTLACPWACFSVGAWREIQARRPRQRGRTGHPGQSSTGWRTRIRRHAVGPRNGQAACPGSWRREPDRAGQRGRSLQAAGTRPAYWPAPVSAPVSGLGLVVPKYAGRTRRGCPHRRFRARMPPWARDTGLTGMLPQGSRRRAKTPRWRDQSVLPRLSACPPRVWTC